jgi:glycosyltransferase EpsF
MWLLALLRFFRDNQQNLPFKVETDVLLTGGVATLFDDEARALGARLIYLRYSRHALGHFSSGFRRILKEGRYHAIHDHQDYAAGFHFLIGLGHLPSVRVAHVHNPLYQIRQRGSDVLTRTRQRAGKKLVESLATVIAGTSSQLLAEYGFGSALRPGGKAEPVYCGFDVTRFRQDRCSHRTKLRNECSLQDDARIILFVGRLGGDELKSAVPSHKNPVFALEVFIAAQKMDRRLIILFAGEPSDIYPYLTEKTRAAGLGDSVRYLGIRRDIPHLMLGSDLLLFPSSAEGLGMVVVEAQAAGLRAMASDRTPRECVVVPHMVEFVPLELGISGWAKRVIDALDRPASSHAEANAAVSESPFSIEQSARHLIEIYSDR